MNINSTLSQLPNKKQKKLQIRQVYGKLEDKPQTEQELFKLEKELYEKRADYKKKIEEWKKNPNTNNAPLDESLQVWSKMLGIVFMYAKSMILKRNKKKQMFTEMEDIEDKAIEAALVFMNQYNRRDDYKVDASFAGALKFKIIEVLYGGREDNHVSINQIVDIQNETELLDASFGKVNLFMTPNIDEPTTFIEKQTVWDVISGVLDELEEVLGKGSRIVFLVRLYLVIVFRNSRIRHTKRLFLDTWAKDYKIEQVLESSVLEVFNRLKKGIN